MSLDRQTRALLDRARGGFEPTARDAVVVEAALLAAVGASGAAGAVTGAGAAKLVGSTTIAKFVIGVLVVSGAIGGTLIVARPAAQQTITSVPVAAPLVPLVTPPAFVPIAPLPAGGEEVVAVHDDDELDETVAPVIATVKPRPAPPAPPAPAPTPRDTSALREELAFVREATSRLHAGNAAGALASFDAHAEAFPNGLLAEERCAGRVFALCALGRTSDARAQAASLRAAHPASAHAARIRESCAGAW